MFVYIFIIASMYSENEVKEWYTFKSSREKILKKMMSGKF